jgi:hypothetical protein
MEDVNGSGSVTEKEWKSLKRSLLVTKILCCVLALLMVAVLAGGAYVVKLLYPEVQAVNTHLDQLGSLQKQIEGVDFEQVAKDVNEINATLSDVDWEMVSDQLNSLDVESINGTLQGLNVEQLEEAIENLNSVIGGLKKLSIFK